MIPSLVCRTSGNDGMEFELLMTGDKVDLSHDNNFIHLSINEADDILPSPTEGEEEMNNSNTRSR